MRHLYLWAVTTGVALLMAASYHLDAAPATARARPAAVDACRHAPGQSGFAWAADGHLICLARPAETVEQK